MKVSWRPKAEKQHHKLEQDIFDRIRDAVDEVEAGTKVPKRLQMPGYVFRLKVGDYRIIFELDGEELVVVYVAHRRDVYSRYPGA